MSAGRASDRTDPGRAPPADEAALVAALQAGDESAFARLVHEQGARLFAVARRLLRNEQDAEDVVQEAFVQAFRNIGRFAGDARLGTWLHRIAVNAALMRLRRMKRRKEPSIEELLPRFHDDGHRRDVGPAWQERGEDVALAAEFAAVVRAAIDRLPDSHRTVLLLRDIEQLDTEETARQLGLSINATKTRLHRARMALRELIAPYLSGSRT